MSDARTDQSSTNMDSLQEATIEPKRRFSFAWLAPLAALALVAFLIWDAMAEQGPEIEIRFDQGHEIKAEDAVAYRGVEVGRVTSVELAEDLSDVVVTVRLRPDAEGIAREDSRFWIVRPEVSLTRVSGIETILGPRFIKVIPGDGPRAFQFDGLDSAPVDVERSSGGLRLILETPRTGSIQTGSGVFYRDEPVGSVLSSHLADDASHVVVIIEVERDYAHLVRDNTRFWDAGGIGMSFGFAGLRVQAESLEALVSGGVGFATPNRPGDMVEDGHRFELEPEPNEDWLRWSPELAAPTAAGEND